MSKDRLEAALSEIFGFSTFRPHQREIIQSIIDGRDVFAVMPTGGGKSLCYQLPACLLEGMAVIVSPLISLMKDQVDAANSNGIAAATLNSAQNEEERSAALSAARSGALRLLYVSPERVNSPGFLDYLRRFRISLFAIDEAHCISEWGHDFRPDYLALSKLAKTFSDIPVAAFTATATARVARDIEERLGLRNPHLTRASFNRPNLSYRVSPKIDFDAQLLEFLQSRPDESGIIYRTTRKAVEATAAMLAKKGIQARAYHAGLSDRERHSAQDDFRLDRCQIVVATIAFGMGIDKPNVRYVVHGDLPKNIEGYYQETGRAGRDGDPAQCQLFYSRADMAQLLRFAAGIEDGQAREVAETQLRKMISFAQADQCRRKALLEYFGEEYPDPNCGSCDVCLGDVERVDATLEAQKALSAMARTNGRFGAMHIADILVGSNNAKIKQNRHDRLPTFGVGKDHDKTYWRGVIEALLSQGLAAIADPQYPTPAVTEAGWGVLRGEASFQMLKQAEKQKREPGRRREAAAEYQVHSKDLFAKLKKLRAQLAEERGIPPYMVFPDKTLREMAARCPVSENELLGVSGVGQHKLQSYGVFFSEAIQDYLASHPDERPAGRVVPSSFSPPAAPSRDSNRSSAIENSAAPVREKPAKPAVAAVTATELATWEAVRKGMGIEEIAAARQLKPETVVSHLERLKQLGYVLEPGNLIDPDRLELVKGLFRKSRGTLLRPVVDAGDNTITYIEARIARLFLP